MANNLPVVTIETFTKIVEMQINEENYRPIFGLGKGGIGKTESIMHLAKEELHIGYVDIRLLLYSETDLKGIPYPDSSHIKTIWLQNNILPLVERDGEKGILVFDEITSCAKSVRTAAYQLLNERQLGEYKLPSGWIVVCLGNGEDDGGDYNGMEGNFANRCSVYSIVSNLEAWKHWAFNNNVNTLVTSYVSFKPEDLHSYNPDKETEMLFSSPRSWTAVSDILNKMGYDSNNEIMKARIIANLGIQVGQSFLAFCKYKNKTISPEDIINNGATPKINDKEVLFITIESVINLLGNCVKQDISTGTITSETLYKFANGFKWLITLSKECAVMGIKDLISYDKQNIPKIILNTEFLRICPEIRDFANENKDVFI